MTRPSTVHFAEVVQGKDLITRLATLDLPALMCDSLVFILYWGEDHLAAQEGGMPGGGEGGEVEGEEGGEEGGGRRGGRGGGRGGEQGGGEERRREGWREDRLCTRALCMS